VLNPLDQYPDYPPIPSSSPNTSSRSSPNNFRSPYYTMTMFGHEVSFKAPPLSPAAILSFCPRADACLIRWAHRSANSGNPQSDKRVENAKHILASSVAGLYTLTDSAEYSLVNHLFNTPSERFDDDWRRLLVSRKVEREHTRPDHPQNTFSSGFLQIISGTWEGRMEVLYLCCRL
jgi:hypothetical protein